MTERQPTTVWSFERIEDLVVAQTADFTLLFNSPAEAMKFARTLAETAIGPSMLQDLAVVERESEDDDE